MNGREDWNELMVMMERSNNEISIDGEHFFPVALVQMVEGKNWRSETEYKIWIFGLTALSYLVRDSDSICIDCEFPVMVAKIMRDGREVSKLFIK